MQLRWPIKDGVFEIAPGTGNIHTKQGFGDCQLHVEWAEPAVVRGSDQSRGNSGIMLMSMYEMQVLDAWQNPDIRGRNCRRNLRVSTRRW